ncbi:glycoside hydrolase xylanase [Marinilabiliaceae bacterium JC017]|nr:glycoside hydrolase xylanase [Marinilabiliaceae bacterium JC017]
MVKYCKQLKTFMVIPLVTGLFLVFLSQNKLYAQESVAFVQGDGQILYADMDHWWSRTFKESGLIGGKTIHYYEPGPAGDEYQKLDAPIPELTPWSTSNVKARVGVTAGNVSVYREPRGEGYCARLETNLKKVVVLGVVNVKAIASGSMYLGDMVDPITETGTPRHNTHMGIAFTGIPSALRFDYKAVVGQKRKMATGGFRVRDVKGPDMAEVIVLLQNRQEDENGNFSVKRIGTGWLRIAETTNQWIEGFEISIVYGDITSTGDYEPYMGLITHDDPFYAKNEKGKAVSYEESEWGNKTDGVTHLIVIFSASYQGGNYMGSPESKLWVDNVELVYD